MSTSTSSRTRKPTPPDKSADEKKNGTSGWMIAAIILIPLGLGGALYLDSLPGTPYTPAKSALKPGERTGASRPNNPHWKGLERHIERLDERMGVIEQRVQQLERLPVSPGTPVTSGTPDSDRQPAAATPDDIAALRAEIEALSQQVEAGTDARSGQLVTLYKLETSIRGGTSFKTELDRLLEDESLPLDVRKELEALIPLAPQGVASLPRLREAFAESTEAYEIGMETPDPEDNAGLLEQVEHNLSSLITIRQVGEEGSTGTILTRAEEALGQDELQRTVRVLRDLEDEAVPYFEAWRAGAKKRLKALRAVTQARELLEGRSVPVSPPDSPGNV